MVIKKTDKDALEKALSYLKKDKVIIMPCDTIYGIVSLTGAPEARIRNIKGRGDTKPFIKLIPSKDYLSVITDAEIDDNLLSCWPCPMTLIVSALKGGTEAVRVPEERFLLDMLADLNLPLISTSVNFSSMPPLSDIDEIIADFNNLVDLIIDGGVMKNTLPSTIIDVTDKPYKVLRQGSYILPEKFLSEFKHAE